MRPALYALLLACALTATAQRPAGPPDFPASQTVHIRPTPPDARSTGSNVGPNWLAIDGFTLRDLLAELYGTSQNRIYFDDTASANKRFDVALNLPTAQASPAFMRDQVAHALADRLHIKIEHTRKSEVALLVTVSDATKLRAAEVSAASGSYVHMTDTEVQLADPDSSAAYADQFRKAIQHILETDGIILDSIDMQGTVADLCRALESSIGQPVLDRTAFHGTLHIELQREGLHLDPFFAKIEAQFGLAIRTGTASVDRLNVTHRH